VFSNVSPIDIDSRGYSGCALRHAKSRVLWHVTTPGRALCCSCWGFRVITSVPHSAEGLPANRQNAETVATLRRASSANPFHQSIKPSGSFATGSRQTHVTWLKRSKVLHRRCRSVAASTNWWGCSTDSARGRWTPDQYILFEPDYRWLHALCDHSARGWQTGCRRKARCRFDS